MIVDQNQAAPVAESGNGPSTNRDSSSCSARFAGEPRSVIGRTVEKVVGLLAPAVPILLTAILMIRSPLTTSRAKAMAFGLSGGDSHRDNRPEGASVDRPGPPDWITERGGRRRLLPAGPLRLPTHGGGAR